MLIIRIGNPNAFVRKNKNKQSKSTLRIELPLSFVAPPKSRDYSRATKTHRFGTSPFSGAKTNSIVTQGTCAREEDRVMFFVYARIRRMKSFRS